MWKFCEEFKRFETEGSYWHKVTMKIRSTNLSGTETGEFPLNPSWDL